MASGSAPVIPPRSIGSHHPPTIQGPSSPTFAISSDISVGPQIPPRGDKSADPFSSSSSLPPPPRPPKSSPAPQVPTRLRNSPIPSTGSNSVPSRGQPSQDENIARLMEMGYSFEDVTRALSIAQNNSAVAVQILQNFVSTST